MKTNAENIEILYSVPTKTIIITLPSGRSYTETVELEDYPKRFNELRKFFAQATRYSINGVRNLKVLAEVI